MWSFTKMPLSHYKRFDVPRIVTELNNRIIGPDMKLGDVERSSGEGISVGETRDLDSYSAPFSKCGCNDTPTITLERCRVDLLLPVQPSYLNFHKDHGKMGYIYLAKGFLEGVECEELRLRLGAAWWNGGIVRSLVTPITTSTGRYHGIIDIALRVVSGESPVRHDRNSWIIPRDYSREFPTEMFLRQPEAAYK